MPLAKAPPRATKKQRQAVVSKNMHILSEEGGRPQKQMIAIALEQAGLSKKKTQTAKKAVKATKKGG